MQSCLLIEEAKQLTFKKMLLKITLRTTSGASKQTTTPLQSESPQYCIFIQTEVIRKNTFLVEALQWWHFMARNELESSSGLQFKIWLHTLNLLQNWAPQWLFPNSKPKMYFPHLPVPKAACFGLNYSQIPQGWVFAVPTLLVPVNFNGQSTIIKMFHEVFRNIHRNLLEGTNQLVTVTTRLRLGDFTALTLIKTFSKIPLVPKTQSRGKKCCLICKIRRQVKGMWFFQRLKSIRSWKNDHRLLQAPWANGSGKKKKSKHTL